MTTDGKIKRLIDLPDHASAYGPGKRSRVPADPIGLHGFGNDRRSVNAMVTLLCQDLRIAGGQPVKGKFLARQLFGTEDTRPVRKLVAYARVHKHMFQIVGVPGTGYLWADPKTAWGRDALHTAIDAAMQMGRCFMFIASLHRREGAMISAVQMIFDFMEHNVPEGERRNDELAAMFAAEGATIEGFLDAFMAHLAKTDKGRQALATAGAKHAQWLLPEETRQAMLAHIEQAKGTLNALTQSIQKAAPAA